jgi:release factor glutamine methyltransferase
MTPEYEAIWAAPGSSAPPPLEIRYMLHAAADALRAGGSPTPRLDADVLLAHVLHISRAQLYARLRDPWPLDALDAFGALLRRRLAGEPVAYLVGHKDFYGLDFQVDRRVLIPRPETEELVGAVLNALPADAVGPVADLGTGSGAIAIALALHRPRLRVYACDISPEALAVAAANAAAHGLAGDPRFHLLAGDLGDPLPERVQGIVANLPYTVLDEVEPAVRTWEPALALAGGGARGTGLILRLLARAPAWLRPGGFLALEIGWDQAPLLLPAAAAAFPGAELRVLQDLEHRDRILWVQASAEC